MELLKDILTWSASIIGELSAILGALFLISLPSTLKANKQRRQFQKVCLFRPAMDDEAFRVGCGIPEIDAPIVLICRKALAHIAQVEVIKIQPDDSFSISQIDYDDDVAMFTEDIGAVEHPLGYYFPMEEVESVADYIRVVLRLRKENAEDAPIP